MSIRKYLFCLLVCLLSFSNLALSSSQFPTLAFPSYIGEEKVNRSRMRNIAEEHHKETVKQAQKHAQAMLQTFENKFFKIQNKYSGNLINGWGKDTGKQSVAMTADVDNPANDHRLWTLEKSGEHYKIRNKHSGNLLNSWGNETGKDTVTMAADVDNPANDHRLWTLEKSGEYYKIRNKYSGNLLNGWGNETGQGTLAMAADVNNPANDHRLWILK